MKVENLFADIKDGVVLLSLLEVLSGEKLAMERGKLKRVHYFSNLSTALKFLENKRIKLVNINVSDIADGKSSIVLGLIWIIILFFQIKEVMVPQETEGTEQLPITALDKIRVNAKKALLSWTENAITKRYGIEVKDFGRSLRDGLAFNAIIHTIRPDLVDMDQVRKQSARVNIESAFSIAEDHLGIARLLDPGDVDVAKPDEKSVMTYVAQFLKTYPEAGEDQSLRKKSQNFAEQELADYKELLTWYQTEAEEVLTIVEPVEDMHQEYMDYLAFKAEVDRRGHIYYKLDEKVRTGKSVKFTSETFKPLEESWKKVVRQTRVWLWKLGASLPGKLGKFGDWVNQAEEILELEEEFLESPNEMAMQLGKILQDHRTFFEEMEPQKIFFQQVPRAGKYEGTQIPAPLMDNLHQRLTRVCTMAPQRERRLEYEEIQYQLLAFLVTSENKLKIWTVKYGHQPKVEALLADYKNFVHSGNLFKNYDQTYETCKRNADAYTKNNDNKKETEKMNAYFDEVNGRWKKVSVEIKSVQFMLEEVIDCWRKYNASVDVLTVWLNDDERVMSRSADEQQQFFADLAKIKEKHKIVNESGNFLIETTEEPVATEIKTTLLMVNRRFQELVESLQHFKKEEVVGKARKDNNDGLLKLTHWLKGAEELMAREVACKHAVLRDYLNDLETFSAQIPAIENDSKTTTETAQSLVKECSQDVVNEMLQSLNIQKEVFVRLRKEIPEKIKHVKAVLPDIESLENGLMDLDAWLSRGEALLQSHTLDGTREETEQRIEKHKVVFSEITYQKSLLDCKNAVYQRVEQMKPKLKNINLYVLDGRVEELNNCFQQMNLVVPIKLEFVVQEEKFLGLVEKAEIAIYQLQQKLQSRENVEETMQKQVMIYQGDFQKTGVKCLDEMDFLSRTLLQHDPRDNTLHNQYGKHRARWDRLKEGTDTTLQLSLQQLPETWKEYHIKLGEFSNCVQTLEEMQRQLQRGYLTSEENKDMQTKFQRALKHIDKFSQDSKWLQSNLEELMADSDNTNKTNERNRLGDMVTRFNNLLPNMETTSNQSAVVSKACDFRDGVKSMIDDLLKQAMDQDNQLFIDGLDEA
ncbi:hypothetical protein DPMN_088486 [Dreissena polymorpha]|uniref:Calponin-homology (CH) domain-containing protein n=1 Tax=Dreissena polymorpha TaxID=45954 RepID=A0A9D4KU70_DREPO|nr:hypothetical protein DPMN_088486 [Dreissena polymorpha]